MIAFGAAADQLAHVLAEDHVSDGIFGFLFATFAALTRTLDPFHFLLIGLSAAVLALGVGLVWAGVSMVWCLAVVALVPWVTVVGYETVGHRHNAEVLASVEKGQTA